MHEHILKHFEPDQKVKEKLGKGKKQLKIVVFFSSLL